jgi:sulfoxide reductase heme-binding subunit YedZ
MFDFSLIDVSAVTGLTAMCLLSLNILMGLLLATNYNSLKQWPRRKLPWPLFRIHNWTGYIALCVAAVHPTILLFAGIKPKFAIGDLLLPLHSPYQTFYNSLGAITFYSFALVVTTSYFRHKLGRRWWKNLHYTSYFGALIMFVHGTLIDQYLKGQTPDFLDGEKVLVEVCCLIVVAASVWRWRYRLKKQRHVGESGGTRYRARSAPW